MLKFYRGGWFFSGFVGVGERMVGGVKAGMGVGWGSLDKQ